MTKICCHMCYMAMFKQTKSVANFVAIKEQTNAMI